MNGNSTSTQINSAMPADPALFPPPSIKRPREKEEEGDESVTKNEG